MEKLGKVDIEYEPGYLYFIKKFGKETWICRAKMNRKGRGGGKE